MAATTDALFGRPTYEVDQTERRRQRRVAHDVVDRIGSAGAVARLAADPVEQRLARRRLACGVAAEALLPPFVRAERCGRADVRSGRPARRLLGVAIAAFVAADPVCRRCVGATNEHHNQRSDLWPSPHDERVPRRSRAVNLWYTDGVRVVGLTGGIASGKSTVAAMFRDRGVPVVDADKLAREVVAPGSEGLAEIVERFGGEVLDSDGSLDRKKLGAIVFADGDARAALDRITHPRIAMASQRELANHAGDGAALAIYEAALIVENGIHRGMAALVVVAVSIEVQLERLMARDGIDAKAATARIEAQLPLADKVAVADHVIDNSGARDATERQVEAVLAALREMDR